MERKLASIQKIITLEKIEGADAIEKATILGWSVVVKKGEFKIDDWVVYCEIDSQMPDKPEFEFLRDRKFRIRTIKLRGQVSQGICFPMTILPRGEYRENDDVTELIGVRKYLTPTEAEENAQQEIRIRNERNKLKKFLMRYSWYRKAFLSRTQKHGFPYWVSKTDEERIQNFPHVLEQFKDHNFYITEKIDYQSVTFTGKMISRFDGKLGKLFPKRFMFVICSRNLTTNDKRSLYWRVAKKYNIEQILKANPTLTIQGEQGDTKVQGNKYQIEEPRLWVFNIFDHEKNYLYDFKEMVTFCDKNKLETVPFLQTCVLHEIGTTVQDLVEFSKGKSLVNLNIHREGVVIRCTNNGQKILSFKVVNPDFLLKYEN